MACLLSVVIQRSSVGKMLLRFFVPILGNSELAVGRVGAAWMVLSPHWRLRRREGIPKTVRYIPYDGGGKALAGLLSGETEILSTGLGEALEQHQSGQIRILAITAEQRSAAIPDIPTLKELGYDATFVNWRGFFGPPGLSDAQVSTYVGVLKQMYETPAWENVRSRNGWEDLFKPGKEFSTFLEGQEKVIGELMRELGFLE